MAVAVRGRFSGMNGTLHHALSHLSGRRVFRERVLGYDGAGRRKLDVAPICLLKAWGSFNFQDSWNTLQDSKSLKLCMK
jgi:hypothetical protein